jgi:hypothetical protein
VAGAGCTLRRCGADSHGIPARCSAHSHLRRLCGRAAPLALPAARDASAAGLQPLDPRVWFAPHVPRGGGGHRLARGVGGQTRACWVVYRIEMESVPRRYNFLHNTAGHLRGTRITRMLAPSQSYTEKRSIQSLIVCPCQTRLLTLNERAPSKQCIAECIYLGSDPRSRRREDIAMCGFLANSHDRRAVAERMASAGATVPS